MSPSQTVAVGVRLPKELLARVDAHAHALRASMPGIPINRTTSIVVLLTAALDALAASSPAVPAPKKKKPQP